MKLNNIFWKFAIVILALPCIVACSNDDNEADEWNANYIYLERDNNLKPAAFSLKHSAEGLMGDEVIITFKVKAFISVTQDVKVTLSTSSSNIPLENIELLTQEVVIKAGETASDDVTVKVSDWSFANATHAETVYDFNVVVGSIQTNAPNTLISPAQKAFKVNVTKATYLNLANGEPANSQLISDRSGWKINVEKGVEGAGKNLIDGTSSDLARDAEGFWFTVDLGEPNVLTGIKTNHWSKGYAPTKVEIFQSDDGATWDSMNTLAVSGATQYITFISPITTRYIKYQIIGIASNNRTDITEFNLYEPITD